MLLAVRDETATGSVTHELTLDLLSESVTVRELIRSRVYQEVDDYNQRQRIGDATFKGLITPRDADQKRGGTRLRTPREIDWKAQFDKACDAFEHNGFFILVDDRQAETLDEMIYLRHDTKLSFVKLVQLVGG